MTVICEKEYSNEFLFSYIGPLFHFILTFDDQKLAAEDCSEISNQISDSILQLACYNYEKKIVLQLLESTRLRIQDKKINWNIRIKNLKFYHYFYFTNVYSIGKMDRDGVLLSINK